VRTAFIVLGGRGPGSFQKISRVNSEPKPKFTRERAGDLALGRPCSKGGPGTAEILPGRPCPLVVCRLTAREEFSSCADKEDLHSAVTVGTGDRVDRPTAASQILPCGPLSLVIGQLATGVEISRYPDEEHLHATVLIVTHGRSFAGPIAREVLPGRPDALIVARLPARIKRARRSH